MHKLLQFRNQKLLQQALTHRSYANENPGEKDNERLEFLGDAILNYISGAYLYHHDPELTEAEMTRKRSALVDEKQLAKFATEIGLNDKMRLGKGALSGGERKNPNLLSSTFEAVVGAYYLECDRNIQAVQLIIEELFNSVPSDTIEHRSNLDPKNRLQEWVQSQPNLRSSLPNYISQKIGGTDHAPEYLAKVYIGNKLYGEGKASGKKQAEKRAAENALSKLKKQGLI